MMAKKTNMTIFILFILCQMLYQTAHLYIQTPQSFVSDARNIYQNMQATCIICLALVCCFGWIEAFFYRRASYLLQLGTAWAAMAIGIISLHLPNQFTTNFVLTKLLPIMQVCILLSLIITSALVKTLFLCQTTQEPSFNRQVAYSKFLPLFVLVRIAVLPIFSFFLSPDIVIYLLIIIQSISLIHKIFYISYYYPETEWVSMVTEVWAWVCLIKAIGILGVDASATIQSGLPSWILAIIGALVVAVCLRPGNKLAVLEKKLEAVLLRKKNEQDTDYYMLVAFIYASVEVESELNYFSQLWSQRFRLQIRLKITEKNHKMKQFLQDICNETRRNISCNLIKQSPDQNKQQENIGLGDDQIQAINRLKQYIQQKKLSNSSKLSFESKYQICRFLLQNFNNEPKYVYEMFYRLKLKNQKSQENIFYRLEMNGLFNAINHAVKAHNFGGTHIQDILMMDQFYAMLQKYAVNEKSFLTIFSDVPRSAANLNNYLSTKKSLKSKLNSLIRNIKFMYPNYQTVILHQYVIQRFIHNNQILSKRNFMEEVARSNMHSSKTKMLNFELANSKADYCVLLCRWNEDVRGRIAKWNRTAQKELELGKKRTAKGGSIQLKDLLPEYWRTEHEQKLQQLSHLNQNYDHDYESTYYICSSDKYLECKNLKVYPYFELVSEMYLLVQTSISIGTEINIYPKEMFEEEKRQQHAVAVSTLGLSQNRVLSKHNLPFMHEVCSNQQFTTDVSFKVTSIFGKQYVVESRQRSYNLQTKKIMEDINEQQLNEDVQALISIGVAQGNTRSETVEKSKQKVDLFDDIKKTTLIKILIICVLLLAMVLLIYLNSKKSNKLAQKTSLFKLGYLQMPINFVAFQLYFQGFIRDYSKDYQKHRVSDLINYKTVVIEEFFMIYLNLTTNLVSEPNLNNIVFQQYQAIDISNSSKTNILRQLNLFNTLTDSSSQLLRQGKYNHWMLDNYQRKLQRQLELFEQPTYIENIILSQIHNYVSLQTSKAIIFYWLLLVLILICVILLIALILKVKKKVQVVLTKPLLISFDQLSVFKTNILSIASYIQISNERNALQEITAQCHKSMSSIKTTSLKHITQNEVCTQNRGDIVRGTFFQHYVFLLFFLALLSLMLSVLSSQMSIRSSKKFSLDKMSSVQQFAQFSRNIFKVNYELLQFNKNSGNYRNNSVEEIKQLLAAVNSVNKTKIINEIMINESASNEILFNSPCERTNICQLTNRTINSFPLELNLFLSDAQKLLLLIQNGVPAEDETFKDLVFNMFISSLAISQQDIQIFNISKQAIIEEYKQSFFFQVVCFFSLVGLILTVLLETTRIFWLGRIYGREMLEILSSGATCRSKAFEYEVNCILHRTNFASQNDQI